MFLRLTLTCVLLYSTLVVNATSTTNSPDEFFGGKENQDYLEWAATVQYPSSLYLPSTQDPNEGIAVHWNIDDAEEYLELGLAVRATGWFGFGISENGGMKGSDVLIFDSAKPDVVIDAYVEEERLPKEDACQDWQLLSSNTDSEGFIMIQVRRLLVTGDTQDLELRDDRRVETPVHRVIAAWGDGSAGFHGSKTARGAVRWFSQDGDEETVFLQAMERQADGSFFLGPTNHLIKPQETEYAKFCISGSELRDAGVSLDDGVALIGFDPVVDSTEHVHHYVLSAGYAENNDVTDSDCESIDSFDIVYVWAPGEPPLALPDNVAFPLGGDGQGYRSFQIEIHYDNPQLKEGAVDNSGVQFYYSKEPREHAAGMLVVGDSTVSLEGESIPRGLSDYLFICPSECSILALNDEPVTVIREYMHMHESGTSGYNQQIRDGEVIRTGKTEYFDFKQQGGQVVLQPPFEIYPGDSFNTRCFFRNENGDRKFGLASSDEMCMAFLLYYPRRTLVAEIPWVCGVGMGDLGLNACDTSWKQDVLTDDAAMQRQFGKPSADQCRQVADSNNNNLELGSLSGARSMATSLASATALTGTMLVLTTYPFLANIF